MKTPAPLPYPPRRLITYTSYSPPGVSVATAGAAIVVRTLEVSGRLGLSLLLLVVFPETQHVVRNASEATLEACAFRRCHAGCMWGGRAPSAKKCLRKRWAR